jgi:antitoxin ParD1/3/4
MMSDTKTVTVDLGEQQQTLDEHMATGRYGSPSEVIQEALQALEREDALIAELMEDKMQGVMDEPATIPAAPAAPRSAEG